MSEMLANQYFISGRFFEAFKEYSKLPIEKQSEKKIIEKMIISAALEEDFEQALYLLDKMINSGGETGEPVSTGQKLILSLENRNNEEKGLKNKTKMKIAILSYFSDREKSLKYFNELKNSEFGKICSFFLNKHYLSK